MSAIFGSWKDMTSKWHQVTKDIMAFPVCESALRFSKCDDNMSWSHSASWDTAQGWQPQPKCEQLVDDWMHRYLETDIELYKHHNTGNAKFCVSLHVWSSLVAKTTRRKNYDIVYCNVAMRTHIFIICLYDHLCWCMLAARMCWGPKPACLRHLA